MTLKENIDRINQAKGQLKEAIATKLNAWIPDDARISDLADYIWNYTPREADEQYLKFFNNEPIENFVIPDEVTSIREYAFYYMHLYSVTFSPNTRSIGNRCFYGSYLSGTVVIPDTINAIHSLAFANCEHIETIEIGTGVGYIGTRAFTTFLHLTSNHLTVIFHSPEPPEIMEEPFGPGSATEYHPKEIYVPAGSEEAYIAALGEEFRPIIKPIEEDVPDEPDEPQLVGMKFYGVFPDNRVDFESHNFTFPYIDLNIAGGRDTDFEIEFTDATRNFYFFGGWSDSWNSRVFACGNDVFELYSGWGFDGGGQGQPVTEGTLRMADGKLYLNGEVIREFSDNGNDFNSGYIYIGAQNRNGSLGYPEDFGAEYSCVVKRFKINGVEYTPYIDENGVGCFRNSEDNFYVPEQGTLEPVYA